MSTADPHVDASTIKDGINGSYALLWRTVSLLSLGLRHLIIPEKCKKRKSGKSSKKVKVASGGHNNDVSVEA
jgi:hypothetical protein